MSVNAYKYVYVCIERRTADTSTNANPFYPNFIIYTSDITIGFSIDYACILFVSYLKIRRGCCSSRINGPHAAHLKTFQGDSQKTMYSNPSILTKRCSTVY